MARRNDMKVIINKRIAKGLTKAVAKIAVQGAAEQAENELIDILSVPPRRTGKIYPRGEGRPGTYQASADSGGEQGDGEAPAVRSEELRGSVVGFTEEIGDTHRAVVGSPLKHGAILQFGTEKMKPRPWVSLLNTPARWGRILKAARLKVRSQYRRARAG